MTTQLTIAGRTDVGKQRRDNQDTFVSQPLWSDTDALLVVIDGVGGYAGGAQAAALAQQAIVQYMASPTGDMLTMLREAVVYANNQIVRQREEDPALARMCCVLTAAAVDTNTRRLHYVHVGDTRLYRLRQGQLTKLTHDHSLVGVREDANQLTELEAMNHPRRNEILRDVGSATHRIDDPEFLESGESDFLPGDLLLLCSDGLTDMITRADITAVLSDGAVGEEMISELIRRANEAGGQDNITVVLARFPELDGASETPVLPEPEVEQTPALPPSKPVSAVESAVPVRNRTRSALLLLLAFILLGLAWWQYEKPTPSPVSPAPVKATPTRQDSTLYSTSTDHPDSTRTP